MTKVAKIEIPHVIGRSRQSTITIEDTIRGEQANRGRVLRVGLERFALGAAKEQQNQSDEDDSELKPKANSSTLLCVIYLI
jgi:hypothetical protein